MQQVPKNKWIFLKEIKPKKMFKLQNIQIYCKNCKKHTSNTFPKKLVLISKNERKGKSKCRICLTERSFIDKIVNKYDLEVYDLQSFIDWCYQRKWRLIAWSVEKKLKI